MVALWLVRSSPVPAIRVLSPGQGHCVVLLGKTFGPHDASPHQGLVNVYWQT